MCVVPMIGGRYVFIVPGTPSPTPILDVETYANFDGYGANYTPQTLMTELRELRV